MEHSERNSKREAYSNTILPRETRKISNNLTLHLKKLEKEQLKPKVSRRKEVIKIRAKPNEIETKKTVETMKLKAGSLKR